MIKEREKDSILTSTNYSDLLKMISLDAYVNLCRKHGSKCRFIVIALYVQYIYMYFSSVNAQRLKPTMRNLIFLCSN